MVPGAANVSWLLLCLACLLLSLASANSVRDNEDADVRHKRSVEEQLRLLDEVNLDRVNRDADPDTPLLRVKREESPLVRVKRDKRDVDVDQSAPSLLRVKRGGDEVLRRTKRVKREVEEKAEDTKALEEKSTPPLNDVEEGGNMKKSERKRKRKNKSERKHRVKKQKRAKGGRAAHNSGLAAEGKSEMRLTKKHGVKKGSGHVMHSAAGSALKESHKKKKMTKKNKAMKKKRNQRRAAAEKAELGHKDEHGVKKHIAMEGSRHAKKHQHHNKENTETLHLDTRKRVEKKAAPPNGV